MLLRRRTTGALAAALVLGGGLAAAGCGSSDDSGTKDLAVLDQAASATAKQQSYHVSSVVTQTLQGKTFKIRTAGDTSGKTARLSLDFADLLKSFGGAAAAPGLSTVLDKIGGEAALKADMIVDGNSILVKMPAIQKALKEFAHQDVPPWASLDLAKVGKLAGVDLDALLANSTGSENAVGYLRALTGSLDKVGTEKVGGVTTTHYRSTIDFADLPKDVPAQLRKALEQTAALLKKTKSSTKVPLDVWVDGQNLIRREVITQTVMGAKSTTTVNISDYGKAVKIDAPPASERFDALTLIEKLAPGLLNQVAGRVKNQIQ
jgi:hypothetical protein